MKRILSIISVVLFCVVLCSCGKDYIDGVYMNADGEVVEFEEDGTCVVCSNGIQLTGKYWKTENGWKIRVGAGIFYEECDMEENGRNLIIKDDLYIKQ